MTATVSALPGAWGPLEAALRARRPLLVCYHAKTRLVSPHALGWKAHRPMLLAYQTGGQATGAAPSEGLRRGWRCMYVDEIEDVAPASPTDTWRSADDYNPCRPFPAIDEVAVAITSDDLSLAG